MKKAVRISILVLVFMFVLSGMTYAKTRSGRCGKNVRWKLSSSGTLTIKGKGWMKDYCAAVNSYAPWYKYRKKIKKIVIKKGVKNIGCEAFSETKAKSVKIPGTVKRIGEYAFYRCRNLKKIVIPEGVGTIEGYVFYSCRKLKQITLPKSLYELQGWNFGDTPSLKTIWYKGNRKRWNIITENGDADILDGLLSKIRKGTLSIRMGA